MAYSPSSLSGSFLRRVVIHSGLILSTIPLPCRIVVLPFSNSVVTENPEEKSVQFEPQRQKDLPLRMTTLT